MRAWPLVLFACLALSSTTIPAGGVHRWQSLPARPPMPAALESGTVPVDGIAMYYAIYGHGDPVLLIHGGLGNSDVWAGIIPALSEQHEVVVADTRGHGRSTWNGDRLSYASLADDYLGLLDHLRIGKVALVGWSDGGIIGLEIAIHHPNRLTCLFVHAANATPAGLIDHPADTTALHAAAAIDAAEYKRLSPTPGRYGDFKKAIAAMWASEPDFTSAQLASIAVPTAIVLGDHDEVVRRDHTDYLARTIPNSKLIILPEVSHFALLQDPRTYARTVLDFVDAH